MKINIKSTIIGFTIGIIVSGITAYAVDQIASSNVTYTPSDNTWTNIDSVDDALDSLYTVAKTYKKLDTNTNVEASKMLYNTTAYNKNGQLVTGNIPTYSGTTIFNASYNNVTVETAGKYLTSNITFNGMDSTYKNLTQSANVTANATYTATYSSTVNSYDVIWKVE